MNPNSSHTQPQPQPKPPLPRLPLTGSHRKIAIAVDLSNESAYAVKWAVQNYLRQGDSVILLHVRPTSVLYGADWGSDGAAASSESLKKLEDDFDSLTSNKASAVAEPLVEAEIPFRIHIVKDHDMKERLCLEVERLGLSAMIMGSRGFGASKGRIGSVSDYCVHHCVCPVVVVRYGGDNEVVEGRGVVGEAAELHPVPEEEQEHELEQDYFDASDEHKGSTLSASTLLHA
ncbi:hypothetical protein RIF29_31513 [Crotalaria pallida]|uniref:UspA domain-containing protein n=1 Tax=Crotalaria pallida TaxID=3830 RepID=A0AAN9EI32_CROPI